MEPEPRTSLINPSTEMAPLPGLSPFRLSHCMSEGQMTPPASPFLPPARHGPKLQLSNFFRRYKSTKSKAVEFHDRPRTTTIRPSVAEMKAPFQLLLPECSSVTETSPSIPNLSPGLRRMSASYYDLRAFAQRQASPGPNPTLLPSPISRGSENPSQGYFHFQNPCTWRDSLADTYSISSEEILTYYCDDQRQTKEHASGYQKDSWTSDDTQIDDEEQSTASESMPVTPSGQEYCETICSDESGWLANTTSHQERVRRFKTRLYQVVQHPWTSTFRDAGEDEVVSYELNKFLGGLLELTCRVQMIATVLVGPGKPKLVHIQRPPLSQASQQGEIAQSIDEGRRSHDLVHDHSPPLEARPCTPVQRPLEISMFSPDTPGPEEASAQHISLDSCISTIAYAGSHVEDHLSKVSPSSENLVPAPLSFSSRTRTSLSGSSIFSSTLQKLQDLADPFGASPLSTAPSEVPTRSRRKRLRRSNGSGTHSQRYNNRIRHSQSWPIDDFPQPTKQNHQQNQHHHHRQQISSLEISPTHHPAALTRLRKLHRLNRVLSSVTQAIDHFPSTLLNLSSPTVLELRPLNVPEETYIDALKRIFPSASSPLLESLAAWILIDLFFEAVRGEGAPLQAPRDAKPRLGSAFSFGSGSGSLFLGRQKTNPHLRRHYRRRESSEAFIDPSRTTSGSGCTVIPSKAQQMLGMNTPDVLSLRLSEHALYKRAESVSVSVAVVGQRLVEAVRGSAGWDEGIWRALRVLVIVISGSGAAAAGSGGVGLGAEMDGDRVPWDHVCDRRRWGRHRVVLDPSLDDNDEDKTEEDDDYVGDGDGDRSRSTDTEDSHMGIRGYRPVCDQRHVRQAIAGRAGGRQRDSSTSCTSNWV